MWVVRKGKQFWNQARGRWTYWCRYATVFSSAEVPAGMSCMPGVEVFDLENLPKKLDADLKYMKRFKENLPRHGD